MSRPRGTNLPALYLHCPWTYFIQTHRIVIMYMLASSVLNNYCCLIFTLNNGLMCYASFWLIMQYEFGTAHAHHTKIRSSRPTLMSTKDIVPSRKEEYPWGVLVGGGGGGHSTVRDRLS